jgi:serralysin
MAIITASRYRDTLVGTADADSIMGSAGPDYVTGGPGDDTIVGSDSYSEWYTPDVLRGGGGNDLVSAPYNYGALLFGDNGDDTLSGSAVMPNQQFVALEGGPGNDLINGNAAPGEQIVVSYVTATGGVSVNLSITTPQSVGGGAGVDTLRQLGGVLGSAHDDVISGGDTPTLIFGGAGDDRLQAGSGGGTIRGDQGNDTMIGGSGVDWVSYADSILAEPEFAYLPSFRAAAGVRVDLAASTAQEVGAGFGSDLLISIDGVEGTRFSDTLMGDGRDNSLMGGAGDDWLEGREGADSLSGHNGADTLLGGAGNDTLSDVMGPGHLEGGDGNDVITGGGLALPIPAGALAAAVANGNAGADTLSGFDFTDWLRGGKGDDSISGGGGNDFLSGDRGDDTISSGAGADILHSFAGAGLDRILDFDAAAGDRVQLLAGTSHTLRQEGADTIVDLGGGDMVVLVGVQLSALPAGWLLSS